MTMVVYRTLAALVPVAVTCVPLGMILVGVAMVLDSFRPRP